MKITVEEGVVTITRPSDDKMHRSLHGLSRTLINNMVVGVSEGYRIHGNQNQPAHNNI